MWAAAGTGKNSNQRLESAPEESAEYLLTNSWVCRLWPSLLISYPYGTERPAFDIRGAVPGGAASQGGKRSGGGRENVQRFPGDTFPVAAEIRPGRSCRAGDEEDAGAGIPAQPDAIV